MAVPHFCCDAVWHFPGNREDEQGDDAFVLRVFYGGDRRGRWFGPATKYLFVGLTLAVYVLGIFFGGIG